MLRILLVIVGALIIVGALLFYFLLLPLGCGMNTTGCSDTFDLFEMKAAILFWPWFLIGAAAIAWGLHRRRAPR